MRIVLGLNNTDIKALRCLREEQSLSYDAILEGAEGRNLTDAEDKRLEEILETLDLLAKIEGVIDNQIELDKDCRERNQLTAHEINFAGTMVQGLSDSERK